MSGPTTSRHEPGQGNLRTDLVSLDDDLCELGDSCAFFCDAVVAILRDNDAVNPTTLDGMSAFSGHIKRRLVDLQDRLENLRARVPAEDREYH